MVTFVIPDKPDTTVNDTSDTKNDESSPGKITLVSETSPLDGWVSFLTDDRTESYASVLPFDVHNRSFTTYNQLDSWFDALHPSQYVASTHSNVDKHAWTPAMYHGQVLLRQTAWVTLDDDCQCDYGTCQVKVVITTLKLGLFVVFTFLQTHTHNFIYFRIHKHIVQDIRIHGKNEPRVQLSDV
jgi:hypothetical protein